MIVAIARSSGLIAGQHVSQDRSLDSLQALADTLPPAQRYASDGHAAYTELVWPEGGEHVVSVGKEETYTIESLNANLRTYLKRLARRSRCFSRQHGRAAPSRAALCLFLQPPPTPVSGSSGLARTLTSVELATPPVVRTFAIEASRPKANRRTDRLEASSSAERIAVSRFSMVAN